MISPKTIAIAILAAFSFGCTPTNVRPAVTQLQLREFQTRSYTNVPTKQVMKAMLNVLQDEGFIVKNADKDLGFISASKEMDVEDSAEAVLKRIFEGAAARYKKNSIVECSVNVSEFGKDTRVRVIFQTKIVDNFGSPVDTRQIEDGGFYREFFSKVDKGIFLEREAL